MRPVLRSHRLALFLIGTTIPCGAALAASLSGSIIGQTYNAADASAFDGNYRGMSTLVASSTAACEAGSPVNFAVKHSQFHFAWRPRQDALVSVGPNGTYSTMLRGSFVAADKHMETLPRIDGYTDGHVMVGEYGTRWCKYSYQLGRV